MRTKGETSPSDFEVRLVGELHNLRAAIEPSAGSWADVRRRAARARRVPTIAVASAAVIATAMAGAVALSRSAPATLTTQRSRPAPPVIQTRELGTGQISSLVADDDGAYVALWDEGRIVRVDSYGARAVASVGTANNGPLSLSLSENAIWVLDAGSGRLLRVDPRTGGSEPLASVQANSNAALASDGTSVWISCCAENGRSDLRSIDAATARTNWNRSQAGEGEADLAVAAGYVWAAQQGVIRQYTEHGVLARTYPRSPLTGEGNAIVFGDDTDVWFLYDSELRKINPTSGITEVTTSVPELAEVSQGLPAGGGIATAAFGAAWLSDGEHVLRIDTVTGEETGRVAVPSSGRIVADSTSLWVISGTQLWQIDPAAVPANSPTP